MCSFGGTDLKYIFKKYEKKIYEALHADLGKSETESFMCEIGLVLSEITYMRKHLKAFVKKFSISFLIS